VLLDTVPFHIQSCIVTELSTLATSPEIAQTSKSHAALCLSECHNLGFGVQYDKTKCIEWINKAAVEGSVKAASWLERICFANSISTMTTKNDAASPSFEEQLSQYSVEEYLFQRIRLQINATKHQLMESTLSSNLLPSNHSSQLSSHVRIFNSRCSDSISPLHVASFLGDDEQVIELLKVGELAKLSSEGFTATHYACLGGHLSTLSLLLKNDALASAVDSRGCTPLHFAFAFPTADASEAVALLIEHGADPAANLTSNIKWDYHDIVLTGDALQCAVRTRNLSAVAALLPTATRPYCLQDAIVYGFWEIAESIINHFGTDYEYPTEEHFRPCIRGVFHWIAHGPEHLAAIKKTLELIVKNNLNKTHSDIPPVLPYVLDTTVYGQLEIIDICLDVFPDSQVKQTDSSGHSALSFAISKARNQPAWEGIIEKFVSKYTVAELEAEVVNSGTYLHLAVLSDSVIATRILLEKGVCVNQHTFDGNMITPIEACMILEKSTEIFSLLIEYGADIHTKTTGSDGTPYQEALISMPKHFQLLEAALDNAHYDADVGETLHGLLHAVFALQPEHRPDTLNAFRYLLGTSGASKYLDTRDKNGMTMVQKAAYFLHLESLALLLEAGADASVVYESPVNGVHLLPLQIVCAWGRLLWWDYNENSDCQETPKQRLTRECVFKVASELLEWHRARPNNPFERITRLHLAYCIGDRAEIERLAVQGFGKEQSIKGCWPGIGHEVSPSDLAGESLENEVCALGALKLVANEATPKSAKLWG
jgi:hypothetical protein